MRKIVSKVLSVKTIYLFLPVLLILSVGNVAHADWHYGIGTGLFRMNAEGDQGFNTTIAGPVQFEVDLDPEDFSDLTKSAFGFGGYATDGKWMIQYSFVNLELEDEVSRTVPSVGSVSAKLGFDITGGEVTLGYPVYRNPSLIVRLHGGARYTKHELSSEIRLGATQLNRSIDNDWTDVVLGVSANIPLAEKWVWNNRFDAGFGGSEGTYLANIGLTWRFLKRWSSTLYGKYTAVEFENGSKGDTDWYLYDVDEFGWGISILYNW